MATRRIIEEPFSDVRPDPADANGWLFDFAARYVDTTGEVLTLGTAVAGKSTDTLAQWEARRAAAYRAQAGVDGTVPVLLISYKVA